MSVFPILYTRQTRNSYFQVTQIMHGIKFKSLVPNDDNRIADADDMRQLFLKDHMGRSMDEFTIFVASEVSIFEVLITLANRAQGMIELPRSLVFDHFMTNLGLCEYRDWTFKVTNHMDLNTQHVIQILKRFNDRTYMEDGTGGGLFPMHHGGHGDQREVELWYQMGAWMKERRLY